MDGHHTQYCTPVQHPLIFTQFRIIGGAVWSATRGTVRVDLVRPTYVP